MSSLVCDELNTESFPAHSVIQSNISITIRDIIMTYTQLLTLNLTVFAKPLIINFTPLPTLLSDLSAISEMRGLHNFAKL